MRRDFVIAILLALAAVPLGVAMMAAPLLFPSAPHWALVLCFYGGIALAFLLIGAALLVAVRDERRAERRGQRNRMIPLLGMMVCGIGFLSFGAWYLWPARQPFVPAFAGDTPTRDRHLDSTVSFNCAMSALPTAGRPDRVTYLLQVIGPPEKGRDPRYYVGTTFFNPSSSPIKWGGLPNVSVVECALANYGSESLLSVSVDLYLEWRSVVKKDNGFTSGEVLASAIIRSPRFDLGASGRNEEHFYIYNLSDTYVVVAMPATAYVRRPGSDQEIVVKLAPPQLAIPAYFLFPKGDPTNPLAAPPQAPAPQGTLEKK